MNIGILGSGDVGKTLGKGLVQVGHQVKVGSRDPKKLQAWVQEVGSKGSAGSFEEAATFGDVIFICTLWAGTENALKLAGKQFDQKIVVDVTNPLDFSKGMPPTYIGGPGKSNGEKIQQWLPTAKVVKAWNSIGNQIMCNPQRQEGDPDFFICGHEEGKKFVSDVAKQWGWKNIVDIGDITKAHLLESMAMLWIEYGFKENNWAHALKLLKK